MQNRYNETEADAFCSRYPDCPADLALRVYTSRLLGLEADLVLHGGGNTSAKSTVRTLLGDELEVLFIKGSGWDLETIEPRGFPALDLGYLRRLRVLDSLSDEEMVNQFRTHMLDSTSPNPSIETLVHAFLPHRFIDHTHADAVVALTNQDGCEALLRAALGEKIGILPFIMPGFPLAKAVAELYEKNPRLEGIVLRNHGIFTFGDDARTAYERMIDYVSRAEQFLAEKRRGTAPAALRQQAPHPEPSVVLPLLRGHMHHVEPSGGERFFHLHLRRDQEILAALDRQDAGHLFTSGVLTPDHVIRTKNYPLYFDFAGMAEEEISVAVGQAFAGYEAAYGKYFDEQCRGRGVRRTRLDAKPRIILVRGLGIVSAGADHKAARIGADIAHHTVLTKLQAADGLGPYRELDAGSIFDMEYWSLEQAKLGKSSPLPLAGRVALVTGGGGAIASGIGRRLLAAGARVFLSDIDRPRLDAVCTKLAAAYGADRVSPLVMDVTSRDSVAAAMAGIVLACGGLDIVVPNAGIAHVADLEHLAEEKFRQVLDVNLVGVFHTIQQAIPIFRRQNTGGHVIVNCSKNVFAPGASFGAYSSSKAGAHQLAKIAALELAPLGVRVNMINADAIFDDQEISSGLWDVVGVERMRSRNLDPAGLREYYRQRNLLKTEVTADHVGNAVVFFASNQTPTTGATLPIDGGIAAAFPR